MATVSSDVTKWASIFEAQAKKYGVDINLLYAIAMQESGGRDADIMQSSEGHGHPPEWLRNNYPYNTAVQMSIEWGTEEIAGNLKQTGGDVKKALAMYNMGDGVLTMNGGYLKDPQDNYVQGMTNFSNYMKNKNGWKVYGDPQYVNHVMRYYDGSVYQTTSGGTTSVPSTIGDTLKPKPTGFALIIDEIDQKLKIDDFTGGFTDFPGWFVHNAGNMFFRFILFVLGIVVVIFALKQIGTAKG
jgi:hypothetical protein